MSKAGLFLSIIEDAMKTYYHVTTERQSRKILVNGLSPRKGSRSRDFGEEDPAIFLFTSIEEAEDAVMNWLGDKYNESTPLVLLEIKVPSDFEVTQVKGQFEATSIVPIPAKYIKLVKEL